MPLAVLACNSGPKRTMAGRCAEVPCAGEEVWWRVFNKGLARNAIASAWLMLHRKSREGQRKTSVVKQPFAVLSRASSCCR